MSPDEATPSTHPASQTWFAMLLANDPNTALIGALRPSRKHAFWEALQRPFEGRAPHLAPMAREAGEQIPGLRPRPTRWFGAALLLALGVGLATVGLEKVRLAPVEAPTASAALPGEPLAATTLSARPAPYPAVAVPIATSVAPLVPEARVSEPAAVRPRAARATVPAALSAKKKPPARRLRRDFDRVLTAGRTSR
ncbi:MAG: hypothetical protein ABI895_36845 [Deltaproteobacteria bacterium]